jgi:cathepsin L
MVGGAHIWLSFNVIYSLLRPVGAQEDSIPDFNSFVRTYGRTYQANTPEYHHRRDLYERKAAVANEHNKKVELWTAGVNEFWDWDTPELSALLGWKGHARPSQSGGGFLRSIQRTDLLQKANRTLPTQKSWEHLQTSKNINVQGVCGSCWAFAAATVLQAATEIKGSLRTFSVQELVACVPNPQECGGQGGCKGATVELAMDWVMTHKISAANQVQYLGKDTTCQNTGMLAHPQGGALFGMARWEKLPENQYEPLLRSIAETGPTAISVDASGWHFYKSGIYNGCSPDAVINHAVVAIGYGQDLFGHKFWLIQNSWGQTWGEHGTLRLLRRDDDGKRCGIDKQPELGSGCKGGPSQVTVCGMCGVLYDSVAVHMR